jgi:hypothetical protein
VEFLAPPLHQALISKVAQHALERGAVIILQAKRAGDLTRADLSRLAIDEGEKVFSRRERRLLAGTWGQR